MEEGGTGAVKMEGGAHIAATVARIVADGIPVMAHIGLTPQSFYQLGGWRIQGRNADSAHRLIDDALALEQAGAFAIVLETIPAPLAKDISGRLHIPTIGIGAGPDCDGQVQVFHDILGFDENFLPKHAKRYTNLTQIIKEAVNAYGQEVKDGTFPAEENSFGLDEATLTALYGHS